MHESLFLLSEDSKLFLTVIAKNKIQLNCIICTTKTSYSLHQNMARATYQTYTYIYVDARTKTKKPHDSHKIQCTKQFTNLCFCTLRLAANKKIEIPINMNILTLGLSEPQFHPCFYQCMISLHIYETNAQKDIHKK